MTLFRAFSSTQRQKTDVSKNIFRQNLRGKQPETGMNCVNGQGNQEKGTGGRLEKARRFHYNRRVSVIGETAFSGVIFLQFKAWA